MIDGNLKSACQKALKQIRERKYAEGLKHRGMLKILEHGIAFYGKECMVLFLTYYESIVRSLTLALLANFVFLVNSSKRGHMIRTNGALSPF